MKQTYSLLLFSLLAMCASGQGVGSEVANSLGCKKDTTSEIYSSATKWFPALGLLNEPEDKLLSRAKGGSDEAYVALAIRLLKTRPYNANDKEAALRYLEVGVRHDNALARYVDGMVKGSGERIEADEKSAHFDFQISAEKGFPPALTSLAADYLLGRGVRSDAKLARVYAEKAVLAGDIRANQILGIIYGKGMGVSVDAAKSHAYSMKAAEAGDVVAAWEVSKNLFFGFGTPKDIRSSYRWAGISYCGGVSDAGLFIGFDYVSDPTDKSKLKLGVEILNQFAEKNDGNACLILSNVYLDPIYGLFDPKKGLSLLRCSNRSGNSKAKYQLGAALLRYGTAQADFAEAENLLLEEAKDNNIEAQYDLGVAYLRGKELKFNKESANYWLHRASAGGNHDAAALIEKEGLGR